MALMFLPYGKQEIDDDDVAAVVAVLRSDFLTTGPAVERFEAALAETTGAAWAVAVSSGTAALHAACFAAGVTEGDEVIVPAVTFLATASCARFLGAEPIFADVDPNTGLIDPAEVRRRVTPRTRAVIPVHLNGATADLAGVRAVAPGAVIIEDAAHALGGPRAFEDGSMATFSFHPVKHVTTGEGGAVAGDDQEKRARLLTFRNHGMVRAEAALRSASPGPWYYEQQHLGHNLRLSDLHAALGNSQLRKLPRFLARRRTLAARYDRLLAPIDGVEPAAGPTSAYHLYAVQIDFDRFGVTRATVMARLREAGVGTQVHYIPLPMQPYYRDRGWRPEDFPGANHYYGRALSLPLFCGMEDGDVDRVVEGLLLALEIDR